MTDSILTSVIDIAKEAGYIALQAFGQENTVQWKPDSTPVTQADQAMDDLINKRLASINKNIPIISEERQNYSYKERRSWDKAWIVDPLDGTKHFIAGCQDYSVNIALVIGGNPMLSVVFAPSLELCYYAIRGQGAFRCAPDTDKLLRCRDYQRQPLQVAISHGKPGWKMRSFLQKCGDHQLVSIGSSLKQCQIAEGRIDVYPRFGKTSEWDTAAAQLILEEAGGSIVDQQGKTLVYNKENLLNPEFMAYAPWYSAISPWYIE